MLVVFIRVIIIYAIVLLFLRLMGKRQIGEMQPYEVVITLIIADLATLPMSDTNIPLLNGLLPLAILVLLHYLITFSTRKCLCLRKFFSGNAEILISPNGIEYETLKKLNMNLDDLQEMVRLCGYYAFDSVQYAIIETNGQMSVIPTADSSPATAKDVKVKNEDPELPKVIISDGKLVKNELQQLNIDEDILSKILNYFKAEITDVLILSVDSNGKTYFQKIEGKYQVVENIFKEIIK